MEAPPRYQPLSRDEGENLLSQYEDKDGVAWDSVNTEIIPTNTRSFVIFMSLLLLSLAANVLLVMDNGRMRVASYNAEKTLYSGLTFDTPTTYEPITQFWNPNISDSEMDAAWDAIDTSPMAVALHDDYVRRVGLPPSGRFPWDTEHSIYYLKGLHDLHCVKFIRKAIVSKHNGENRTFDYHHLNHCLNGLRQDIMCAADDTPMPALTDHIGEGQVRKCRNWDRMVSWAKRPDRNACFKIDDYRDATHTLEQFAFCPPDSPYRSFQEAYFEYHGHKDMYEPKADGKEIVVF